MARARPAPQSPFRRRLACLALATVATLAGGCTFEIIFAPAFVATGGIATFRIELFNDQIQSSNVGLFTVAHVPVGWQLDAATFVSSTPPLTGSGVSVIDPGFACDFGAPLPAPGPGRKRVVVSWGTVATVINPTTAVGTLRFAVGSMSGTFPVEFFVVLTGGAESACSLPVSTTTPVFQSIFSDGFESGDTSAWSATTR